MPDPKSLTKHDCRCQQKGYHYHCPQCGSTWFCTVDLATMTTNECKQCSYRYLRDDLDGRKTKP